MARILFSFKTYFIIFLVQITITPVHAECPNFTVLLYEHDLICKGDTSGSLAITVIHYYNDTIDLVASVAMHSQFVVFDNVEFVNGSYVYRDTIEGLYANQFDLYVSAPQLPCVDTITFEIREPNVEFGLSIDSIANSTSSNPGNGFCEVIAHGGWGGPIVFIWSSLDGYDGFPMLAGNELNSLERGDYLVCATDSRNCEAYLTFSINQMITSNSVTTKESLYVYPNPTSDFIEIEALNILSLDDYNATIYNRIGEVKLSDVDLNNSKVNVTNLEEGLYFLQLNSNSGTLKGSFIKIDN